MQPAPFALDLGARDQVVVHVQQLSAFRAEPVQHAASDQLPVGLGVAQGGVVPGQVGLAISAVFGKAVVAVPLDMLFQDGAAQATRPAVDQQDESVQIQPQRVDRLRVADGVDALQFGEVVAAAYGAQRLPMADIGGRQLVHERLPAVIQRSVDIAEPLFQLAVAALRASMPVLHSDMPQPISPPIRAGYRRPVEKKAAPTG